MGVLRPTHVLHLAKVLPNFEDRQVVVNIPATNESGPFGPRAVA